MQRDNDLKFEAVPDDVKVTDMFKNLSFKEKFGLRLVSKKVRALAFFSYKKFGLNFVDVVEYLSNTQSMEKISKFLAVYRSSDAYKILLEKISQKKEMTADEIILFALTREAGHTGYLTSKQIMTAAKEMKAGLNTEMLRNNLEILVLALQYKETPFPAKNDIASGLRDKLEERHLWVSSYINLSGLDFQVFNFSDTNLSLIDFTKSNLNSANFSKAGLRNACMIDASLMNACFIDVVSADSLCLFSLLAFQDIDVFKKALDQRWSEVQQCPFPNSENMKHYLDLVTAAILKLSKQDKELLSAKSDILYEAICHPMFNSDQTYIGVMVDAAVGFFKPCKRKTYPTANNLKELEKAWEALNGQQEKENELNRLMF